MVQIPINPFDNDRLKTRKVQAMLNDLGVLPAKHDDRPSFLRSRRSAAVLIDRALDGLAVDPNAQKHCCKNSEDFVTAINSKFASAFLVDDGGAGLPAGAIAYADFQNGTFNYGGNTFEDFLVQNPDWGPFNGTPVAGQGLVGPPNIAAGPALAAPLATSLLAAGGFTVTMDWLANDDGNVSQIYIALADVPAYANFWQAVFNHETAAPGNDIEFDTPSGQTILPNDIAGGEHRVAITWDSTGVHCSLDGGAVLGVDDTLDLGLINLIGFSYGDCTWRRLVFYTVKTHAELQTLSVRT